MDVDVVIVIVVRLPAERLKKNMFLLFLKYFCVCEA